MRHRISQKDIESALGHSPWDFGNGWLYRLCREHPRHDDEGVIIAKIWLIGRSYSAAIERRKTGDGQGSDLFYERKVATGIFRANLDEHLGALPPAMRDPRVQIGRALAVHEMLLGVFEKITGEAKRSLASKYLHFHRPDLFFLYDSRARGAIATVTPKIGQIQDIESEGGDVEYRAFCRRALWLTHSILGRFGKRLTPRQLDRVLLRIAARMRRPGP